MPTCPITAANFQAAASSCYNAGGVDSVKLNNTEYRVVRDRCSVEDKYTYDVATGVGFYTVTLTIEFGYSAANAKSLEGLARNLSLDSVSWTNNGTNESSETKNTLATWTKATDGGSAYLVDGTLLSGQKLEDGSKITGTIEIKCPNPITYAPAN